MKSSCTKSDKQRFVTNFRTITFRHQAFFFSEYRQYSLNITSNYVTYNRVTQ